MSEVETKAAQYEQTIRNVRADGYRQQESAREEAFAARTALISKAKADTDGAMNQAKTKLQEEAAVARKRLDSDVDRLAEELTATLLKD